MTNSGLLKQRMDESGYKIAFIAEKCGLTYQGFLNKVKNKAEFKASEIRALCDLLEIDKDEKEAIFFCD